MKIKKLACLIIAPIILAACADSTSSIITSSENDLSVADAVLNTESNQSVSTDTQSESTDTEAQLIGVCGEILDPESFVEEDLHNYGLFDLYYYMDYGYISLLDGKIYNSYDNPDKFDLEEWKCTEQCEPSSGGVFSVSEGDVIGGLTCTLAEADYYMITGNTINDPFGLIATNVYFDGEVEVTGYIYCNNGNEGYVDEGEMHFYPDDSWSGLPIPYFSNYWTYAFEDDLLIYAPFRLSLGTIYDYPDLDFDLERYMSQGETVRVECVLKDIQLKYRNTNFGGWTISKATIESIEIIA